MLAVLTLLTLPCNDMSVLSRELNRSPLVECETGRAGDVRSFHRRVSTLPSVSLAWMDAVGLWPTAVAGRINGAGCVKRAVSRPVVARGCCPAKAMVNLAVLRMVVNAVCGRPAAGHAGWVPRWGWGAKGT